MFEEPQNLYTEEEIRGHADHKGDLARLVVGCISSEAWKMFLALVRLKEIEILRKSDYKDLKDFKADRAGLRFMRETIAEFVSYKDFADEAVEMLGNLRTAELKTPLDLMEEHAAREEG